MAALSTGSAQLDALIEELQPQDNVVFFTETRDDYAPFVATLVRYVARTGGRLVYVRGDGAMDDVVALHPDPVVVTVPENGAKPLLEEIEAIGGSAYYVFEPLRALVRPMGGESAVRQLFLTVCPRLFALRSVAYWDLAQHQFAAATVAAIQDCTQVFIRVDRRDTGSWVITPQKVWGRYSDAMFQPHLARITQDALQVTPLSPDVPRDGSYVQMLAEKNRELAEVRDILNRRNDELRQRNVELALLNQRVSEQSRLYESLRSNLDHLSSLFQAGWEIGGTLVRDQVHEAILQACERLFVGCACRLCIVSRSPGPTDLRGGEAVPGLDQLVESPQVRACRAEAMLAPATSSIDLAVEPGGAISSVALSSIVFRGRCVGTIEIYADDLSLNDQESRMLLSYLAAEGSIALDNAELYQETNLQRDQLRTFVSDVIRSDERESRQLALDLHDGLVQMIVGSYQHFQAAQAWRGREATTEQLELAKGIQILREAIMEARRLISQLRPAGLDDFGLEQALRLYLSQARAMAPWDVAFTVETPMPSLMPEAEASLFRIVQEAVTNALKHSQADLVDVRLKSTGQDLVLSIQDSGCGFDPGGVQSQPERGLHVGLVGIRERARMLGGSCTVESSPGAGTTIAVTVPLAAIVMPKEGAA